MIVLAFFAGVLVLMLAAAVLYDRQARRRGLRPGVSEREVTKRQGTADIPTGDRGRGGIGGP